MIHQYQINYKLLRHPYISIISSAVRSLLLDSVLNSLHPWTVLPIIHIPLHGSYSRSYRPFVPRLKCQSIKYYRHLSRQPQTAGVRPSTETATMSIFVLIAFSGFPQPLLGRRSTLWVVCPCKLLVYHCNRMTYKCFTRWLLAYIQTIRFRCYVEMQMSKRYCNIYTYLCI